MTIAREIARVWAQWGRHQPKARNPYTQSIENRVRWIGMEIQIEGGKRTTQTIFSPFGFYLGMSIRGTQPSHAYVIPPGVPEERAIDVTFFWQPDKANTFNPYELGAVYPGQNISIVFGAWRHAQFDVRFYYLPFLGVH